MKTIQFNAKKVFCKFMLLLVISTSMTLLCSCEPEIEDEDEDGYRVVSVK